MVAIFYISTHPRGGAGVVLFFCVSGYIITRVLIKEEPIEFIFKRFFRIYPLYIFAVIAEAALNFYANGQFVGFYVLLKQMALVGDFLEAPHALAGVEWTLRIEVLFYLTMAALKISGLINGRCAPAFPHVLFGIVLLLLLMPPFPGRWAWNFAYLNLYAPFLFLGAFFYLLEERVVTATACSAMAIFVVSGYWISVSILQPAWITAHFVVYAIALFYLFWVFRGRLSLPRWALLLSELTYSVYLFHNWLYDWVGISVKKIFSDSLLAHSISVLILFFLCWVFMVLIEKPFILLGKNIFQNIRDKRVAHAN